MPAMVSIFRYVTALIAGIFIFAPLIAIGALEDCPDAITAYWKLDESTPGLYDDFIGSNTGSCTSCPGTISGTIGNGQGFDGSNSITLLTNSAFNWNAGQSFTIELWARRSADTLNDLEVFIGRADDNGLHWYIGINSSGNAQALLMDSDGSGPASLTVVKPLTSSASDYTWHHIALVRDGETATTTLYVDGDYKTSQSHTYNTGFTSETASVALGSIDGGSYFRGGLDELAVYSRALGADEIRSHYYISRGYCNRYESEVAIMPMGDSITKGVWTTDPTNQPTLSEMIGYRSDLWHLLRDDSVSPYWIGFIGSQSNGSAADPDFDPFHASFGGMTDDQLYRLLHEGYSEVSSQPQITEGPYLETYDSTELILLHIGTNELDADPATVGNILDEIDDFSKNITVLVARIINQVPENQTVTDFNDAVENLIDSRKDNGDKLIMIDMEDGAGLNYTVDPEAPYTAGDMYEDLHPNPSGYGKMADLWFAHLSDILPQSELPFIASLSPLTVVKGELYTATIAVDGLPSPDLEITNGVAGDMALDSETRQLTWIPTEIGDYAVTVRAVNWVGTDEQTFTISVVEDSVDSAGDGDGDGDSGNAGGGGSGGGGCFIDSLFVTTAEPI